MRNSDAGLKTPDNSSDGTLTGRERPGRDLENRADHQARAGHPAYDFDRAREELGVWPDEGVTTI
ncbi:MAG: hypothetical protein KKE79_05390 [Actinobacteria bacterium]|nr:hypothetical protein [Actinomycetota bacterium]MBU4386328.1 hypothetical protein [Actinomycetota bacterium]MBU4490051.1 hypothetical protein [Actinomycetota bacterium]